MEKSSLIDIYKRLHPGVNTVFVVPLIKYDFKSTDYLYLLYKSIIESDSDVSIKSISALNHFRIVIAQFFGQKNILHYHWLEFQDSKSLIGMPYKLFCIWLFHLFGGTIIWTVHNLEPHDQKFLSLHKRIHIWMARKAKVILVHSESAKQIVSDFHGIPIEKIKVHPHPAFPAIILDKKEAVQTLKHEVLTKELDDSAPILLMIGSISAYKQIPQIVDTLARTSKKVNLIVAGAVKKGQQELHQTLSQKESQLDWFHYIPSFISENLYPVLISSSDMCLFNYSKILTSGGIEMAKAYFKPIIAPKLTSLEEYKTDPNFQFFSSLNEFKDIIDNYSFGAVRGWPYT